MQWQPIDTSDWYKIDGYNIGLAEYCPAIGLVHFIAAYTGSDGVPNSQTHIIPAQKYRPANKTYVGLVMHTYEISPTAMPSYAIARAFNGGFQMFYGVDTKAYRIYWDILYSI